MIIVKFNVDFDAWQAGKTYGIASHERAEQLLGITATDLSGDRVPICSKVREVGAKPGRKAIERPGELVDWKPSRKKIKAKDKSMSWVKLAAKEERKVRQARRRAEREAQKAQEAEPPKPEPKPKPPKPTRNPEEEIPTLTPEEEIPDGFGLDDRAGDPGVGEDRAEHLGEQ